MKKAHLRKTLLSPFLDSLRRFGELHGPTSTEAGVTSFAPLREPGDLLLDYSRTLIPPKKYLLPFRDDILQYQGGSYRQSQSLAREIVLFGVHPCDLDGIAYLDRVFLADQPDPGYRDRRASLTLIGISCQPDDYCFCSGSREEAPCDLFLSPDQQGFSVTVFSAKGAAIAEAAGELLSEAHEEPGGPPPETPPTIFPAQAPELRFSGNPLWGEFAKRCLSCGACSVCCPTCYCFDVRESPPLAGGARRMREWDNCLFATHGEVAGGNFRATRLERLRYRFLHKYCGFSPLQGISSCVGCGRCKKACPVGIDLREVTETPGAGKTP